MCAVELKSPQPISFSRGTGYTEPMHRGASGKVIPRRTTSRSGSRTHCHGLDPALQDATARDPRRHPPSTAPGPPAARSSRAPSRSRRRSSTAPATRSPSVCVFGTELRMVPAVVKRGEIAARRAAGDIARLWAKGV